MRLVRRLFRQLHRAIRISRCLTAVIELMPVEAPRSITSVAPALYDCKHGGPLRAKWKLERLVDTLYFSQDFIQRYHIE